MIQKRQEESSLRKAWNILAPFLVYFVVHDLAQVLSAFLLSLSLVRFGGAYRDYMMAHAATVNGIMNALALLAGMASVWPMARKELAWVRNENRSKRRIKDGERNENKREQLLLYSLLAVFAVTLALGANILLSLTGITGKSAAYENIARGQYGVAFIAGLIIYGILSPVAEEIVFRGLIYNRMKHYFNTGLSVAVCAVLFGIYHGNLVQGVYGCILGLAITGMYECFHSFAAPVLFHALANAVVFTAGYRQEVLRSLITPLFAVLFLAAAAFCLTFILLLFKRRMQGKEAL